jgi:hypothetical protein
VIELEYPGEVLFLVSLPLREFLGEGVQVHYILLGKNGLSCD